MYKLEYTATVKLGEATIDEILIAPLTFMEMTRLWKKAAAAKSKPELALQRARIMHQTHFMSVGVRQTLTDEQLHKLPITVAKGILAHLDDEQGKAGKLIGDGDGATTSIIYELGTPIGMKNSKGEDVTITELEFHAETYGDIEDVLAADSDMSKTVELLKRTAKPVGVPSLQAIPGWALDRFTIADGVTIMLTVLPRF